MSKRFIFSMKAPLNVQNLLASLGAGKFIIAQSCIVVITEDDQVAALLGKLDTAEQIQGVDDLENKSKRKPPKELDDGRGWNPNPQGPNAAVEPAKTKMDKRKYRYNPGEGNVECPKCHNKVVPMYMLKDGSQCKMCAIKAKRLAKSQESEKSPNQWTSGISQSYGHYQDNLADLRSRPKDKINLDKLSGVKLG